MGVTTPTIIVITGKTSKHLAADFLNIIFGYLNV